MSEPNAIDNIPRQPAAVGLRLGTTTIEFKGPLAVIPIAIVLVPLVIAVYLISRTTQTMLWASAILWILFIGYWSAVAGNSSATKSSESPASRQLHQLLMYGALAIAFIRLPGLDVRLLPNVSYLIIIGLAVQVSSGLFAVWARRHLGRNWSGAISSKVDHQLIRTGPYRFVRHPIYSAMLGMFLGTALVSGEPHAMLALIIISAAYWRKIRLEEQNLREVFGSAYDEYRQKTWAVIPGLW